MPPADGGCALPGGARVRFYSTCNAAAKSWRAAKTLRHDLIPRSTRFCGVSGLFCCSRKTEIAPCRYASTNSATPHPATWFFSRWPRSWTSMIIGRRKISRTGQGAYSCGALRGPRGAGSLGRSSYNAPFLVAKRVRTEHRHRLLGRPPVSYAAVSCAELFRLTPKGKRNPAGGAGKNERAGFAPASGRPRRLADFVANRTRGSARRMRGFAELSRPRRPFAPSLNGICRASANPHHAHRRARNFLKIAKIRGAKRLPPPSARTAPWFLNRHRPCAATSTREVNKLDNPSTFNDLTTLEAGGQRQPEDRSRGAAGGGQIREQKWKKVCALAQRLTFSGKKKRKTRSSLCIAN